MTADLPPAGDAPATIGGHYRLLHPLEGAGLGRTYLAMLDDRCVAVKVFPEVHSTPEADARWAAACDALVAVRHTALSGTVAHGFDPDLGARYLVQELVTGVSLGQLRRMLRRPLTPVEAANFLLPIANALVYCHSRGITHGRISADHVLLVDGESSPSKLVGLRPHGGAYWPAADGPDWSLTTEDPEHGDVLALAAVAHFLTFGVGGEGPDIDPATLDDSSYSGEDPSWELILQEVLGNSRGSISMVDLRDALLSLLANEHSGRRASSELGASVVRGTNPGSQLAGSAGDVSALLRLKHLTEPLLLTLPMSFRDHDSPLRAVAIVVLLVIAIVTFAIAAGGTGPG